MMRRIGALLLRMSPASFRERYGAEVLVTMAARVSRARRGSVVGAVMLQLRELGGLLLLVVKLRAQALRGGARRDGEERRSPVGAELLRDVRYGVRALRADRGYAATAVLVLTLGIGASVAIFSAANAFLLRPLPFADADRLMMLYETNPEFGWTDAPAAPANMLDWRERVDAFAAVAGFSDFVERMPWVANGEPVMLVSTAVTGNFFETLGVRPALGRAFTWEETWEGRSDVVVLSHALWQRHFGGNPGAIGSMLDLGSRRVEVVGVMPPGFGFPSAETELWVPWGWSSAATTETWFRRAHFVRVVARLKPGVTRATTAAQLEEVVQRLQREYPETNSVMGAGVMPIRDFLVRDVRRPLWVLLGAVTLLLLLSCANVANLTIVRGATRARELALRHALGAGRVRLVRQLLTESCVLAAVGGALGIAVGWLAVRAMASLTTLGIEGATAIALDHRVVAFACGATLFSSLLFGTVPALRSTSAGLHGAMIDGGTNASAGRSRMRAVRGFVIAEVALAMMLVAAAALMTRSFMLMRNVDPGFSADGVLAVQITAPSVRYPDRDAVLAFQARIAYALAARGIERVGIVGQLPLAGTSWSSQFQARGWPAERVGIEILHRRADEGYFATLGIPLLRGRMFDERDGPDAPPTVVINETFAREHFPAEDPIGQLIAYDRVPDETSIWREIVGIVGDQHQESLAQPVRAEVFENARQDWGRTNWFVLRTRSRPIDAVPLVRSVLADIDPLVPITRVQPLRDVWRRSMEREQFVLTLLGIFGVAALLLAAVGVYAVTAQAARSRTREIGIRLALGAEGRAVTSLLLRQSLRVVALGVGAGLLGALAAGSALSGLLFGVAPSDPLTLCTVTALLMTTAAAASYLPVRRALRGDPLRSLRADQP